jgi:hypothetical protein
MDGGEGLSGFWFWLWVIVATNLGVATHVGKKMLEEKAAAGGIDPDLTAYLMRNKLEFIVMGLTVGGALLVSHLLQELTVYAAYMTGIAGGSVAGATGATVSGAKNVINRFTGG